MRSRAPALLSVVFFAGALVLPHLAHATGIPFFGPVVPAANATCAGSWEGLIQIINNLIALMITLVVVFVAPLMIAYAGFLLVVNPLNPGGKEQAKKILQNGIIGLIIALAGWLIVDAVLTALTSQGVNQWTSQLFSSSTGSCLSLAGSLNQGSAAGSATSTAGLTTGGSAPGASGAQCSSSNPACSVDALQAAGYTQAQANAMACIAVTESSGNPNTPNSSTGACGTFQITQGNWNTPGLHQGSCSSATSCNDSTCNMQAAFLLSQQSVANGQSVFQPWTCSGCNASAQSCISQYDPSGT